MNRKIPLQIWAPLFYKSPFGDFSLDLERAYNNWLYEDRIWLMPDIKKIVRWKVVENGFVFYEAAVPSDNLNVITIYHTDEFGRVYPSLFDSDKNIIESCFYKEWLKIYPDACDNADYITVKQPVFKNDKFECYEEKKVNFKPGPMVPITDVNIDDYKFTTRWPPLGKNLPNIVSPEVDSKNFYGKLKYEELKYKIGDKEKKIDIVSSEKQPGGKAINKWIKWPEPFYSIFPDGGNIDLIYHHAHMRYLIDQINAGDIDKQKAIKEVENLVNKFSGDGETTLGKSFIMPRYIAGLNGLLLDVQGKFGIDASNISELFNSNEFEKLFFEKVKIKRIYSWLGYFWWEFYQDASANKIIRSCKNCGNIIIGGRSDRVYCSEEENKECFKQRSANRQKKRYHFKNYR